MKVIVKSGRLNWSGTEFSKRPAEVYPNFDAAAAAVRHHHLHHYVPGRKKYVLRQSKQKIEFFHLEDPDLVIKWYAGAVKSL